MGLNTLSNLPIPNPINSCIHIEPKRISRRRTIPDHVSFELNPDILSQIVSFRNSNQKISLSADNLAELRYYFLLNTLEHKEFGLTFKTNYYRQEAKITIIKSVISLSGKAEQYIRIDALASKEILETHYWLIEQIFTQIPFKYPKLKILVLANIARLILILLALVLVSFIPMVFWGKVLLLLFLTTIIFLAVPYLLTRYLSSWLLNQLLFGIFSYSRKRRKIGLSLLQSFI